MLLALVFSCGASPDSGQVPPDLSLTIDQYLVLGIPKLELDWTADQRSMVRSILRKLAEHDPVQLPRFASDRSGSLFEKLVQEEIFRRSGSEGEIGNMPGRELDQLTGDQFAQIAHRGSLAGIYAPESTGGLLFDRELVEIGAHQLRKILKLRAEIAEKLADAEASFTTDLRGQDFATRYRELLRTSDGVLVQQLLQMAAFAIAESATPPARDDATSHILEQVPQIAPLLSIELRGLLGEALREASAAPTADPRLAELSSGW